jgi:hypothetical protein
MSDLGTGSYINPKQHLTMGGFIFYQFLKGPHPVFKIKDA